MTTAPERAADYHADHEGRLSSTGTRLLNLKTAAHCKAYYDGYNNHSTDAMTLGTAVHQMLLRDDRCVVSPYDEYRTNEAKAWKAATIAAGKVPIKQKMWDEAREIAQHVNGQILAMGVEPTPFTKGTAEHVLRWETRGAKCRALLDWVRDDLTYIDDLKTTVDASPAKFARHIFNMGYDIQAAFYVRGICDINGGQPEYAPTFRWVVVETKPPYLVTIHTLSERAMHAAQVKVDTAIQLWNECTKTGVWPAYPNSVQEVDIPGWVSDAADEWADIDLEEVQF